MSSSLSLAQSRLAQERKNWRKDHPFGFVAKPESRADGKFSSNNSTAARLTSLVAVVFAYVCCVIGSTDIYVWKCLIPGRKGTDWEGGHYPLTLKFSGEYPQRPPTCYFPAGFFHPNVYDSGRVCLSIFNEGGSWKPSISVKVILEGIQALLTEPNIGDAAQSKAYQCWKNKTAYKEQILKQAKKFQSENNPV